VRKHKAFIYTVDRLLMLSLFENIGGFTDFHVFGGPQFVIFRGHAMIALPLF
jgi:hypothetical protein